MSADGTGFGVAWHDLPSGRSVLSTQYRSPGLPVWLPDGRRFIYAVPGDALVLFDTRTGETRTLGQFDFDISAVLISPDGNTIIMAAGLSEADIWLAQRQPGSFRTELSSGHR